MIHQEHITVEAVLQKHGEDALPHGKSSVPAFSWKSRTYWCEGEKNVLQISAYIFLLGRQKQCFFEVSASFSDMCSFPPFSFSVNAVLPLNLQTDARSNQDSHSHV
jgi:hypothetical protein